MRIIAFLLQVTLQGAGWGRGMSEGGEREVGREVDYTDLR